MDRTFAVAGVLSGGLLSKFGKIWKGARLLKRSTDGSDKAIEAVDNGRDLAIVAKRRDLGTPEDIHGIKESATVSIEVMGASKFTEVLDTPWGSRPSPSDYLPKSYIDNHLAKFDEGASRFMPKSNLESLGPAHVDGTSFVLPKSEADLLLSKAGGDKRILEESLGMPVGFLDAETLVRVDIPNPKQFNPRVSSGNEAGASDKWLPGGLGGVCVCVCVCLDCVKVIDRNAKG